MESLLLIAVTIVWFLLVLSFLVLIHELGHFLAAKWIGTHVEEFGLGYPPRVKKLFTKWHTVFTINALPFGGFVRIWGDDAEQLEDTEKNDDKSGAEVVTSPAPKGSIPFSSQPQWKRLVVILAGIAVNFVFGVLAFATIYSVTGIPERTGNVVISRVIENSPAQAIGLQAGDEVVAVETDQQSRTEIHNTMEFIQRIELVRGQEVQMTIRRDGEEQILVVTPRTVEETPVGQGSLGVGLDTNMEYRFYPWYEMPFRGMVVGVQDAFSLSGLILQTLGDMVGRIFLRGQVPSDISGPVGIVDQAVQMQAVRQGWMGTLNWAGLLSINLAVMNLLPIPALDGGRAVFIILETFIGKARRLRWERLVNGYSFFFLIGLILLITLKDVVALIF